MKQPAHPTYPLFEPLEQRWSPKTFSRRPLEPGVLRRLLEAARWAPSCFNEQPWRFIVAARDLDPEGHAALSAVIVDKNRQWAQHAPVLMLSIASMNFARNGRANRWATHDTGQAVASMLVQATTEGLLVHQMGGFDQEAARQRFAIPEGYEPIAAIAVGYPPNADEGDPAFLAMDAERHRTRHSQDQFAFGANGFGTALTTPLDVHRVLEFWFGDIGVHGMSNATAASRWWRPDPDFDAQIQDRFGDDIKAAKAGLRAHWACSPRGRLALILLLDQFNRNIHRGTPEMFAGDPIALQLAVEGMFRGEDTQLRPVERAFFIMPLIHSEQLEHQVRAQTMVEAIVDTCHETVRPDFERNLEAAKMHRDLIERFGRFPHRNAILGRTPTPEEETFMKEKGTSFGAQANPDTSET